ncbi:pectin lyase-like protein [Choiromyces venosus 120613-1]|uniref:Pectin lyase-like protein n=1 Tax=Choiromyces venosus 120613-1 TaxID=1336337 RepID=A0A3N4JC20_9PEZI|nr:pectin lyase-like protein [Choiromyces venosus 120613-1]
MKFSLAAAAAALFVRGVAGQLVEGVAVGPTTSLSDKSGTICNVLDYGAVADGATDIGVAITKAFSQCVVGASGGATLLVPEGEYLITTAVILNGGGKWAFQLDGLITLSEDGNFNGNAIVVRGATDFEMLSSNGKGAIQGQGYKQRISGSGQIARLLRFMSCVNYSVHDLILIDSPTFHMFHNDATNLEAYHITIRGGNKGGLDGIDLICTSNCHIHHVEVTNRDECISVKTPSKNVLIEEIYCNQSGGMSIGSLNATSTEIEFIHMRNIYVHQCTQMLMIKTWPGGTGASGYVRNSIFENFQAYDTTYALDIDQYWYRVTEPNTGAIEISSLQFRNWTGTVNNGVSRGPIVIRGSNVVPLTGITMEDFSMWTENRDVVVLQCNNVYGSGYCARELASGATPTSFSSTVTISSIMEGFVSPTSPAWGVGTTGYGLTVPIPVYTPAAMWGIGATTDAPVTTGTVAVSGSKSGSGSFYSTDAPVTTPPAATPSVSSTSTLKTYKTKSSGGHWRRRSWQRA